MRIGLGLLLCAGCLVGFASGQALPANGVIPEPPPSAPIRDWVDGPGRPRVELDADGATLRGWVYSPRSEEATKQTKADARDRRNLPVVLFFNGNAMTIDRADPLYRAMSDRGAEVLVYDYRGYGFSEGTADVAAFRSDALRIYDKAARQYAGRRVVVYGFSLGTAMAAYVASERPVAGLILAAPFATAEEELPVFAARLGIDAETLKRLTPDDDAKTAFDELAMVHKSLAPMLVLHGSADSLVPIGQGREVYRAGGARDKRFVELPGVGHGQTPFVEAAVRAVLEFLRSR